MSADPAFSWPFSACAASFRGFAWHFAQTKVSANENSRNPRCSHLKCTCEHSKYPKRTRKRRPITKFRAFRCIFHEKCPFGPENGRFCIFWVRDTPMAHPNTLIDDAHPRHSHPRYISQQLHGPRWSQLTGKRPQHQSTTREHKRILYNA